MARVWGVAVAAALVLGTAAGPAAAARADGGDGRATAAGVGLSLLSVASGGTRSNFYSFVASTSADGRYTALASMATNLVAGDTNAKMDVFVRDRIGSSTGRVSISTGGAQGNSDSFGGDLSADGRYVAFGSDATNLVAGDTNASSDIFVRDRVGGTTRRVSVTAAGGQANGVSANALISANGRYVAFSSDATNLVAGDTNGKSDVFVRDLVAGTTRRVSVSTAGAQGNGSSYAESISADGRHVAIVSDATNLVGGDTNASACANLMRAAGLDGCTDVFLRDRAASTTTRVSVANYGSQANGVSFNATLSADARYVVFSSTASNLVAGDTNGAVDVFVRDRVAKTTRRVSVAAHGGQGNGYADTATISADGRYVVFASDSANLVSGDTNHATDVFVRDRVANTTTRLSVSAAGVQGDDASYGAAISANGRCVAFNSWATNLVSGDVNGATDVFMSIRTA